MGYASSNAVRRDDAYGSLGGSFGGSERKLKKKPVLVLDPEELAKAHQLFQIGAAEQLGEFDPRNRISVPAAAVFGMILGGVKFEDEEDDYVAPTDLAPNEMGDEEEEPEEELPPIDLDALLALTRAEQEEEDEFQRYQAEAALLFEAPDEPEAAQPVNLVEEADAPEIVPAPTADASTADALARILSRAAARPQQAPLLADLDLSEIEPPTVEGEAAEPLIQPVPEELVLEEPAMLADEPAEEPQRPAPEPVAAPTIEIEPEAAFSDSDWPEFVITEQPFETLDNAFEGESSALTEAPARNMPVMGEEGVRSTLRARLVREETTLVHPEPTAWRKLAIALRRFWQRFS